MEQTFLTKIEIKKVRHLKDVKISLSDTERKHLILTGKNGSGKTSVLEALRSHLEYVVSDSFYTEERVHELLTTIEQRAARAGNDEHGRMEKEKENKNIAMWQKHLAHWTNGVVCECVSTAALREKYGQGKFILAYYPAERKSEMERYADIQKVDLSEKYAISDRPGEKLAKYMVNLKATQAFALQKNERGKAEEIEKWFERFENVLREVFEDSSLKLDFNIYTYQFGIIQEGKEPFDFNTMSSGYAAIFNIITDLMMRMEAKNSYNLEGIVLIDEIDTHLHIELQRKIMPMLTNMFPNVQFIVTTHSPFILSSADNSVIYDLENRTDVREGLSNLPVEGIVEGYFGADRLSEDLRKKFERYKYLAAKGEFSDDELEELNDLAYYLDEIPDYLAPEISAEYGRLKLEWEERG